MSSSVRAHWGLRTNHWPGSPHQLTRGLGLLASGAQPRGLAAWLTGAPVERIPPEQSMPVGSCSPWHLESHPSLAHKLFKGIQWLLWASTTTSGRLVRLPGLRQTLGDLLSCSGSGSAGGPSLVLPLGTPATPHPHLYEAGIGDQLLGVHHVHQRLLDGHIFDAGHVKAIYVLPPWGGRQAGGGVSPSGVPSLSLPCPPEFLGGLPRAHSESCSLCTAGLQWLSHTVWLDPGR